VNDLAKMKELKKMGVDGLISDYPNLYIPLSQNK
jgi:glycerophosphoryl diester phosphodiesterase